MLNYIKLNRNKVIVVLGILLIVLSALSFYNQPTPEVTPVTVEELEDVEPFDTRLTSHSKGATKQGAAEAKNIIREQLPIAVDNFETSSGITTQLYINSLYYDANHILRVTIEGVDYFKEVEDYSTDSDVIAFKESFEKIKSEISAKGVDPEAFFYLFNSTTEEHNAAQIWVAQLDLLN